MDSRFRIKLNASKTRYLCPECSTWVDLELTVIEGQVQIDFGRMRRAIVSHVTSDPENHPVTARPVDPDHSE